MNLYKIMDWMGKITLVLFLFAVAFFALLFYSPYFNVDDRPANELSALSSLRMIDAGQSQYRRDWEDSYASGLEELAQKGYIIEGLEDGKRAGYRFEMKVSKDRNQYQIWAIPLSPEEGRRAFYTDHRSEGISGCDYWPEKTLPNSQSPRIW